MKKIILTAIVAVSALAANAQVWLAGNVGYNFEKQGDAKTHNFVFEPEVGYNLNEKWGIGLNLTDKLVKHEGQDALNNVGFGMFARFTFAETGIAKFFVDGGFGMEFANNNRGNIWNIGFRPGVKIEASKKVALVAKLGNLGFSKTSKEWAEKPDCSRFGFAVNGEALSFGVEYNF